ncbi:MAG: hypothetical protein AB1Z98_35825 [Nannocystaceae bacterium]
MSAPRSSPAEPTTKSAPTGPNSAAAAAYAALESELDRTFGTGTEARNRLRQPLAAVREAMAAAAVDPAGVGALAAALDGLEDVLEAHLRRQGWPTSMRGSTAGSGAIA